MSESMKCHQCQAPLQSGSLFCPECGTPVQEPLALEPVRGVVEYKEIRKPKSKIIISIVVAALALIVLFLAGVYISKFAGGSKKHLLYFKDSELNYNTMPPKEAVVLTSNLRRSNYFDTSYSYSSFNYFIYLSEDGKYIFYPDANSRGDLTYYWRALSAGQSAAEKAVKIDSDIKNFPVLSSDGNSFYYIKNGDLYLYDRKSDEKKKLANDVEHFYLSEKDDYLVFETIKDDRYDIFEIQLNKKSQEKIKIDTDSQIRKFDKKNKSLYYFKKDNLYYKPYGKDKEKIATDVERILAITDDGSVYYLKEDIVIHKMIDFIDDDLAAVDDMLSKPTAPAYPPAPSEPSKRDFLLEKTWVSSVLGTEWNEDLEKWGYWREELDEAAYQKAIKEYDKEYSSWKDEIEEIDNKYEAELELYNEKEYRNLLRDELASPYYDVTFSDYSLYFWQDGKEQLVASSIIPIEGVTNLDNSSSMSTVFYQKRKEDGEISKQRLSKLVEGFDGYFDYYFVDNIIYDLREKIYEDNELSDDVFVSFEGIENKIEAENAAYWSLAADGSIYYLDDFNEEKDYGVLTKVTRKGDLLNEPKIIDDDVSYFLAGENNKVYYFKYISDKDYSADLYLDGEFIASDVSISSVATLGESDHLAYLKDYSYKTSSGELYLYKGGKEILVSDDVYHYNIIDKDNIVFLQDYSLKRSRGDLMLANQRGKAKLVDQDVNMILRYP